MAAALVSRLEFDASHPSALAVYCSDGRFTRAVEELLEAEGHPRLDTLTLPGGPALFELTTADFAALEAARGAATFLVRSHGIRSAALIAHEGCGHYRARNAGVEARAVMAQQVSDLRGAAAWFRRAAPGLDVKMYYARISGGRVAFHVVADR